MSPWLVAALALPVVAGVVALAAIGAVALWARFAWRRHGQHPLGDEVHFVRAADGWRLALHRVRPRGPRRRRHPIVLAHGLGVNANFWLLATVPGGPSWAEALAELGYDVWCVEWRGAGLSRDRGTLGAQRWVFDDIARHDAPAALAYVRAQAGGAAPFWVGHSMGGLVAYAHLGAGGAAPDAVRALVTLASPGRLDAVDAQTRMLAAFEPRLRFLPGIPLVFGGVVAAPLWRGPIPRVIRRIAHVQAAARTDHIDPEALRGFLANVPTDMPRSLLGQFAGWVRQRSFDSHDRAVDYAAGLARIAAPTLVVAAAGDSLVPLPVVEDAFAGVGAPDKRFVCVGRATGAAVNYGHGDLVLGRDALRDVFPLVRQWLDAHGGDADVPGIAPRAETAAAPAPAP